VAQVGHRAHPRSGRLNDPHTAGVATIEPRLRFSLAHLTLLDHAPPDLIELAARVGYDHVGLRIIPMGLPGEPRYELARDTALLRRTRAALAATGLTVLDVELAQILAGSDVSGYQADLECAAELGAHHVLCSAWCPDDAFVIEQFVRLCELAHPLGLRVEFEFVTFNHWATLGQAVSLMQAANCDNAGICVDTLHFNRSGHRPEDLDGLPRAWFGMAQICDGPKVWSSETAELKRVAREERLFLGDGGVNVRAILEHMPLVPYSIELPNLRLRKEYGAHDFARRCLQSARTQLDGLKPPHSAQSV
jgi:sugar phosphate isomerase/epimerase